MKHIYHSPPVCLPSGDSGWKRKQAQYEAEVTEGLTIQPLDKVPGGWLCVALGVYLNTIVLLSPAKGPRSQKSSKK